MASLSASSALSPERACEWDGTERGHWQETTPCVSTTTHSHPHPHTLTSHPHISHPHTFHHDTTLPRNMAEALISKGYGKALRHRQDDDLRSSCYDELLSAEARAEKNRKGLFNKKEYTPIKVADFSGVSRMGREDIRFEWLSECYSQCEDSGWLAGWLCVCLSVCLCICVSTWTLY